MYDDLKLIGRDFKLFEEDLVQNEYELKKLINESSFLVIGGGGSIGQAVSKELFERNPKKLHIVDINENNLVELVRDIRSSFGYIKGEFKTFVIDIGNLEFELFMKSNNDYDYIFNLSALKHVRSERDPYTLIRLIKTNIINAINIARNSNSNLKKYFCVSSDKATNPFNMMGASKRIMETFLMNEKFDFSVSTARFANVAFSDGSLLYGFTERIKKKQPLAAPNDVSRYFVSFKEAGQLCLFSCLLGKNKEIFFPILDEKKHLQKFSVIARNFLREIGFEPYICLTEEESRTECKKLIKKNKWPCWFFDSETTGEKLIEEFYTSNNLIDLTKFNDIGIILDGFKGYNLDYSEFVYMFENILKTNFEKNDLVELFKYFLPDFNHVEKNKNLDEKM